MNAVMSAGILATLLGALWAMHERQNPLFYELRAVPRNRGGSKDLQRAAVSWWLRFDVVRSRQFVVVQHRDDIARALCWRAISRGLTVRRHHRNGRRSTGERSAGGRPEARSGS